MTISETLELILKRERVLVLIALIAATALAWIYLVFTAAAMAHMPMETGNAMAMAQAKPWGTAGISAHLLGHWRKQSQVDGVAAFPGKGKPLD